jgi:hypothetical protein
MTPEALIFTSDFELCHMLRLAVERFGISVAIALSPDDALKQLERNKFDLMIVDCSNLEQGCTVLQKTRLNPTHRSAVSVAMVVDREHTKYVCDSGANFVVSHANYETEIAATLRSAYGLVLRERGRYNRFPTDNSVTLRCGDYLGEGRLLNISEGGVCVGAITSHLSGAVQLRFALEAGGVALQVNGNVAWQREGRIGVQFTHMPKSSRSELDAWLAREFEAQSKAQRPAAPLSAREKEFEEASRTTVYGNYEGLHPIVTGVVRGGPVRARCSGCQATITFGNTIAAPLEQERKLREAFIAHVKEKHQDELAEVLAHSAGK